MMGLQAIKATAEAHGGHAAVDSAGNTTRVLRLSVRNWRSREFPILLPPGSELLGGRLNRIEITDIKENTYYAALHLEAGGKKLVIMAGPCAVERLELTVGIAHEVKAAGASVLRGGAYKPRTSPYSFQGLGREGLDYLLEAKKQTGLPVVSEILDTRDIELFLEKADIIQIGARNMQNFELLKEVGAYDKPVLLKRGLSATIKEFLLSAEYIMSRGNRNVMLCERGIRTFETQYRNTLDLAAIPTLKELSHLPVIVDPSHATGKWQLVAPMSKAAIAAGADGLLIEVHSNPECALCDGEESIRPSKFKELMHDLGNIGRAVGREI